jgi:hypothetical protein
MKKRERRIEILPHPNDAYGFLVVFPFIKRKNVKEEVDEIRKMVMVDLLERKYLPKPTEVEKRDGLYCFLVAVKESRSELLEDLKQALNRALERKVKKVYWGEISIKQAQHLAQKGFAVLCDGDKKLSILERE